MFPTQEGARMYESWSTGKSVTGRIEYFTADTASVHSFKVLEDYSRNDCYLKKKHFLQKKSISVQPAQGYENWRCFIREQKSEPHENE